jgi:phage gp45-like
MKSPYEIVKDSSIWYSSQNMSAMNDKDPYLRLAIVKKAYVDKQYNEMRFLVEVQDRNDKILATCRVMNRYGGVFNYEDVILRGYKTDDKPDKIKNFSSKAGDIVLVAFLNGESREGVILGGMHHTARKTDLKAEDGPQYKSEFNGIETSINKDGEYKLIFKGQPLNIAKLSEYPSKKIEKPKYDEKIEGTFSKFDKTGSWIISDNVKETPQFIKIDKPNGKLQVISGKVALVFIKKDEIVTLNCKTLTISSIEKISNKTKDLDVEAEKTVKIKTPKIAIGTSDVELLDQLTKLIEKIGLVKPISPVGPCTPMMATPEWSEVDAIKAKIAQIKGAL